MAEDPQPPTDDTAAQPPLPADEGAQPQSNGAAERDAASASNGSSEPLQPGEGGENIHAGLSEEEQDALLKVLALTDSCSALSADQRTKLCSIAKHTDIPTHNHMSDYTVGVLLRAAGGR